MKTFLHVGCGPKRDGHPTRGFSDPGWAELRLDIDEGVNPDIVGTMTDMSRIGDGTIDAVFSSHNIEHLYPHEVPKALSEFARVLNRDGFAVVTCPDLQSVAALVAEDKLTEEAYQSPAGSISALDMLYGYRPALADGNLHMAHRCGFTQRVLIGALHQAGFTQVAAIRRPGPFYDIWALAMVSPTAEQTVRELAALHFPE